MNDTSAKMHDVMLAMMMQKSSEDRLKMGASMFDTARCLVRESLKGSCSGVELRRAIFVRFYGNDFSPEERRGCLSLSPGMKEIASLVCRPD